LRYIQNTSKLENGQCHTDQWKEEHLKPDKKKQEWSISHFKKENWQFVFLSMQEITLLSLVKEASLNIIKNDCKWLATLLPSN